MTAHASTIAAGDHQRTVSPRAQASLPRASAEPDAPHLDRLRDLPFDPVFIMGDHRSGTTLLYQLLARTGRFSVVTAYHLMRYREVLANHFEDRTEAARTALGADLSARGLTDRLIDNVRVSPDTPEEYGFLIAARHGGNPRVDASGLPTLVELCRKLRVLAPRDQPVLLKSPWDYTNFDFLSSSLPGARFVFIHRDPVRVIDSQLRATRTVLESRSPYTVLLSEKYRKLHDERHLRRRLALLGIGSRHGWRIFLRSASKAAHHVLDHAPKLPPGSSVSVRYEDLCADTVPTLRLVLDFLSLDPHVPPEFSQEIRTRNGPLLPEIDRNQDRIRREFARYCRRFGYPSAT